MDRHIVLCPGQGAQSVGMGKAWFDASEAARDVFNRADALLGETLGKPLSTLCFKGPADALNATNVSQPALFVAGAASLAGLCEKHSISLDAFPIAAAAGLSLGEYTALYAAGVFSFEDGLKLVALRGQAMQDAAVATPSSMVAIIGGDETQAYEICQKATSNPDDILVCANFNAPGQIVLSGSLGACETALNIAQDMGLRATQLAVAGAFHSPLMQPAADRLAEALARTPIAEPRCPVLSNVTGQPHEAGDGDTIEATIRQRLTDQLTSPVRWEANCRWLIEHQIQRTDGADGYIWAELSPGRTISGLMRRIDRSTKVRSYDNPEKITLDSSCA